MASFRTYEDRNRDLQTRRTAFTVAGAIGLGVFLSMPEARKALGQGLVKKLYTAGTYVESKLFSGSLRDVAKGVSSISTAGRKLALNDTALGLQFRSFGRLVGADLPKQNRREIGISYLVQKRGWSSKDAQIIFGASNKSFDILSRVPDVELLQHPYYRKRVIPNLSQSLQEDAVKILQDVAAARSYVAEAGYPITPAAYREANRLFAKHLQATAQEGTDSWTSGFLTDRMLGRFGVQRLRLESLVSKSKKGNSAVAEQLARILKIPDIRSSMKYSPAMGSDLVVEHLTARMKGKLSSADVMLAKAAYSLSLAGAEEGQSLLPERAIALALKLPTEIVGVGDKAYNLRPLINLGKAGWETFSNNFVVPVAPGMGGLMPFKFMPWNRGFSKDFAGTFGAGTKQREIYEALPEAIRSKVFDSDQRLINDFHYIGNKIFGTYSEGEGASKTIGVVSLDDAVNNWRARDVRFGFGSDFARIRSGGAQDAQGNLRTWAGESPLGKFMDFLGLDMQGEASKFSRGWSAIGKMLFPRAEKYASNPVNALTNVLRGSNSVDDIEAVLRGVTRHASVPAGLKPSSLFTSDVMDMVDLHPGLRRLVQEDFSDTSIATALREIDAVVSAEAVPNAKYFDENSRILFRGLHTRINARRFAQNDVGTLAQGIVKGADPGLNLDGLFGDRDPLQGFARMRDVFYEEIFAQMGVHPLGEKAFSILRNNASQAGGITSSQKDVLMAHVWSLFNQKYMGSSFLDSQSIAEEIAGQLRNPADDIGSLLQTVLSKWHGGTTPWINPNLDVEDIGSNIYAVPAFKTPLETIRDMFTSRDAKSPALAFLKGETGVGYGDAVAPGPMYHMGYRLNKMLTDYGLGLPDSDLQNTSSIFTNLFLKRVLPVFAGVEAWKYLNYESDRTIGFTPDKAISNIRAHVALAGSKISDIFGITNRSKAFLDLTPGLEDYWQPRSYDEQMDYLTSGYEPVRRGRWWLTGSRQAFVGDRVQYYLPSWYQLAQSNWQGAENSDLNTDEYWRHSWIPTPSHPFSPINRILDPYWWEEFHSKDRPYVISGEMFEPNTLLGNLGNMTIGRLLKPQRMYHPEALEPHGGTSKALGPTTVRFTPGGGYEVLSGGSGGRTGRFTYGGGTPQGMVPVKTGDYTEDEFNGELISPIDPALQGKRTVEQYWDLAGIYGYQQKLSAKSFGLFNTPSDPVLQSPSRGYGYERRYWDRSLGGIPGELSEFWRRVLPHRDRNVEEYNPVPNNMADWMAGDDYFMNFRRGDPYVKTPMGEVRLPGVAYERIHGVSLVKIRASSLGMTAEEIAQEIISRGGEEQDTYFTRFGNYAHARIQEAWEREGILESKEIRVFDPEAGISGHFDAILNVNGNRSVAEIKTMGGKKFAKAGSPLPAHVAQLNFYMHVTNLNSGKLIYVNRDDTSQVKTFDLSYNHGLYRSSVGKAREAVSIAAEKLRASGMSAGALYDSITRVEVLSDVAPWSNEYKLALQQARADIAGEHDPNYASYMQQRVTAATKRASTQKKLYHIRDYRFNQDTSEEVLTVKSIIDPNTFQVEESKHPIRFAGVRASRDRIADYISEQNIRVMEGEDTVTAFYRTFGIVPGSKIRVVMASKADGQISDDLLKTRRAAVFSNGVNINKELIDSGVGIERTTDNSAPGIVARYSSGAMIYGGLVEKLAHLDTPFHTKLWQVRSALEQYKRTQVYGTVAGDWASPYQSYVKPTLDAIASRNPIFATLTGAFVGSLLGKTVGAKRLGTIGGAAIGAQASIRRILGELITGEKYIPDRVRNRRDIEEYYDALRYVKYTRLSQQYNEEAKRREGMDALALADSQERRGESLKSKLSQMEARKRGVILSNADKEWKKRKLRQINRNINRMVSANTVQTTVGPLAAKALMYRDLSRRTITGANAGDPLNDVMGGLPRYERELAMDIVQKGTAREKREFFSLLTKRQQAALGPSLGISKNKIPEKESLYEYFRNHQLPDSSWEGWKEDFDLNNAKIVTASEEGVLPMEMGIYPRNQSEARIATQRVPIPVVHGGTRDLQRTLHTLLEGAGVTDISIDLSISPSDVSRSDVDIDIQHNRSGEVAGLL